MFESVRRRVPVVPHLLPLAPDGKQRHRVPLAGPLRLRWGTGSGPRTDARDPSFSPAAQPKGEREGEGQTVRDRETVKDLEVKGGVSEGRSRR